MASALQTRAPCEGDESRYKSELYFDYPEIKPMDKADEEDEADDQHQLAQQNIK